MTNLEELIQTAKKLGEHLEVASREEKRFCVDICIAFENLSRGLHNTANELETIKNYN